MLVAFCLYKYFPYGGLQRDFLRIAQNVEAQGHHIRVYVQEWSGEKPSSFEIIEVPVTSRTNHGQGEQFVEWTQKHLKSNPVDVVVGFNKMPGLDVYYAADVCYEEKVVTEKRGLKGWLYRMTSRYRHFAAFEKATFAHGQKTKLMMIAESQIKDFKKHYETEDNRFILLPPGIAPDRKYSNQPVGTRERFRSQNQISSDQLLLLQLGSDFKRKGVDRTLRAIACLPKEIKNRVMLMVVGQDKPARFQELANRLGVQKNVRFFSGRDDVPEIMAATDVFLHPAYTENTGTVILEAVVAGLPVIVTEVCGYSPYIAKANCGVVVSDPYLQDSLNRALYKLLKDDEYRMQCSENAKHFADTQDLYSMIERATDVILSCSR